MIILCAVVRLITVQEGCKETSKGSKGKEKDWWFLVIRINANSTQCKSALAAYII